ncbi:MAG: 6-carboxytetrahydropterin synthase [Ignavibacteriaceae bacterium]|jgi:6-pyruvoyltetrahydropterin/6-carboxytetrahydropterin synthase|nr:6-carboxytetrahydropterin synthase [Ignavibacteriaceae bacterium]MCW8814206.1 6-carboxytetrahydropterin synthase [Chlorobium sp.]MCW8817066.1 6-carboxytetrahydropterin synthase [Ignavibacteriaceae bacterium]MCW8962140.1 6-carboxytetrahydropterin synthase [Ignavibacteriaceae bacterium]MCW9094649.1 6-carboxytetrahydropterin synthase [Ignavibacteriaceae bacterium]
MVNKVYLTRRETFAAAHRLFKPELSDKENFELFGKCSNPNWHGHNYTLEVTVAGEVDSSTGFVLDIKKLKEIILENVISKVDHKNLNLDTDFMKGIIPTSENITIAIWNQLEDKIPGGKLYSVKLYETENNYFEYKGE